ncbi:MAG TPA: coenzyme F420-0:L-glutamate ligase [Candidatus Eremiobacteraceae bacterium]|nr:coenzyme F420-0:L-glutamate ligase [Candidatus Eremiobacteraceae bacterium]
MNSRTFEVTPPGMPPRLLAIPVRTPLVRSGDDLPAMVAACVTGIASADDVICVSETTVAIAQGRSIAAEFVRPTFLARLLADHAGIYATVSQPESLQLVMDKAGAFKVLYASAAAAAGRVIGRHGDFYRILGSDVAEIDGYTGTMPPYERHIVFGPDNPGEAAANIARVCGAHAAIVDVNDLHKVEILGSSAGISLTTVTECLRGNPHGNSDQQTPIVVLKYRPAPGSPVHNPLTAHP